MLRHLGSRLGGNALLVLALSFLMYGILGLMPGDPLDAMLAADPRLTAEDVARLKAVYGLDKPLTERYIHWLKSAFHGDLGYSRQFNKPVMDVLWPHLKASLLLMLPSFILALAASLALALCAVARPGGPVDWIARTLAVLSIAVPTFWLGLLLLLVFAVSLNWLPGSVLQVPPDAPWTDKISAYVLPVATLAFGMAGGYLRYLQGSLAAVLPMPFMRTALAKGAPPRRVLFRHGLRNAALPFVTVVALSFGGLFSGALITETLFGITGLGRMIYDAIAGNDYNLALAGLLLATICVLLSNLAADAAYGWLDPRIRYAG
mgnify:CR=1 FL=1